MTQTNDELLAAIRGVRAIALDGGTTNTRARLIENGQIVATARREVGIRDAALGQLQEGATSPESTRPPVRSLTDAVRQVIEEVSAATTDGPAEVIVAAGMLSSEFGLRAVPHVFAPAGVDELAGSVLVERIAEVSSAPIYFVPGVRTAAQAGPEGWTRADVMRGEECETLGAVIELIMRGTLASDREGQVFVWPGSHTKVVALDHEGRIAGSQTSLAGELLQALTRHTLISASLPASLPKDLNLQAVAAGARAAEEQGLARAAFLVRVAAIEGALSAEDRAAFFIGAVVADDVRALSQHPILSGARWVGIGGREPLRQLYAETLSRYLSATVVRFSDELCERSSAFGALAVALAARKLQRHDNGAGLSPP